VRGVAEEHAGRVASLANLGVRVDRRSAQEGVAVAVERGGEGIGDVSQGRGGESHGCTSHAVAGIRVARWMGWRIDGRGTLRLTLPVRFANPSVR
jgi:hypothetical protein